MGVPSVTASSSSCTFHSYQASLNATPVLLFQGRGNLYGFLVEDNSGDDIFVQVFDAASAGDVTVGTTVPAFTFRVKAEQAFGKDVNDSPYKFFSKGCVVAVTTLRGNAISPAVAATGQFWFVNRQP
ncbi:hypothetical protein EBZ38_03270 [bacterium]|nr:hypothetical protein [bacterium]NDC93982.1 hypothetical protein [bacterium]NDD83287.1 hypothetical protein [bacterium]